MESICCLMLTSGISLTQSSECLAQILLPQAKGSLSPYFQPALALLAFIAQPVHCNEKTAGVQRDAAWLSNTTLLRFSIARFTFFTWPSFCVSPHSDTLMRGRDMAKPQATS